MVGPNRVLGPVTPGLNETVDSWTRMSWIGLRDSCLAHPDPHRSDVARASQQVKLKARYVLGPEPAQFRDDSPGLGNSESGVQSF